MMSRRKYRVKRAASMNKAVSPETYRVTTNDFNPFPPGTDVEAIYRKFEWNYKNATCPRNFQSSFYKFPFKDVSRTQTLPSSFRTQDVERESGRNKRVALSRNGIFADGDLFDKLKESSVDAPPLDVEVSLNTGRGGISRGLNDDPNVRGRDFGEKGDTAMDRSAFRDSPSDNGEEGGIHKLDHGGKDDMEKRPRKDDGGKYVLNETRGLTDLVVVPESDIGGCAAANFRGRGKIGEKVRETSAINLQIKRNFEGHSYTGVENGAIGKAYIADDSCIGLESDRPVTRDNGGNYYVGVEIDSKGESDFKANRRKGGGQGESMIKKTYGVNESGMPIDVKNDTRNSRASSDIALDSGNRGTIMGSYGKGEMNGTHEVGGFREWGDVKGTYGTDSGNDMRSKSGVKANRGTSGIGRKGKNYIQKEIEVMGTFEHSKTKRLDHTEKLSERREQQAKQLPEIIEKEYRNARITVSPKRLRFSLPPSLIEFSEAPLDSVPDKPPRPRSVDLGDVKSARKIPKYESLVGVAHNNTRGGGDSKNTTAETIPEEDAKTITPDEIDVDLSEGETVVRTEKIFNTDGSCEEKVVTTQKISSTECEDVERVVTTEKIIGDDGNECKTRTETVIRLDSSEDKDTEKLVTKIERTTSRTIVEVDTGHKTGQTDNLDDSIDREEQKREGFRYFERLGREASLEGLKLRNTPEKSSVKEEKIVPVKAQRPRSAISNFSAGPRDAFTGLRKTSPHSPDSKMNTYDIRSSGDFGQSHKEDMMYADSDPSLHVTLTGMTSLRDSQYSPTGSCSTDTSLYSARSPRSPIKTNGSFSPPSSMQRPSPNSSNVSLEIHHAIDTLDSAIALSSQSSVDSGLSSDPSRQQGHFVVVAIDFGTTYSGYAFSFTRDPSSVHMMRKWEGGDPGVINQKTPTTLLLTPDERFHSFGFSARDHFHDLDPQEAKKWLYFEKFKMFLHHHPDLNETTMIPASNGKEVPAINVFAHSLMFFKEHALQELSDQSTIKILNEDVRWVITVPAIWKQPAKQFMRQAAYKAGIASSEFPDQILIALEPEAASIYCRRLRMYQLVPEAPVKRPLSPRKENLEPMNMDFVCEELRQGLFRHSKYDVKKLQGEKVENIVRGTRYMVVDCGGGTVDITVHQLDENAGKLRELHKATGGPHGSVGVDKEFERLLCRIFSQDFVDQFKFKRPAGFVDLMIAFESRKRAASPYKENPLNVSLPFSFIDYYKKSRALTQTLRRMLPHSQGCPVDVAVKRYNEKYNDKDVRWSSQGMLRLNPEGMRRLFQPTLEKIVEAVGKVLNHPDAKGTQYVFLVGGFAESPILQHALRKEFGHIVKMIIPQDMGLTILKGAVLFGLDPTIVSIRKSRLTYGVGVLNKYNSKRHPKDKLVKRDGVEWCTDVFDKFVSVNQPVALGDTVLRSYTPAKPGQKQSVINIYCTDREKADFITDRGVKICGTIILDLTDSQYQTLPRRREIQARMLFGDTEIKVSALDVATGRCVKAAIDFLNK